MRVEFLKPGITQADIGLAVQSIKTGWLVHGKYTNDFERELDKFLKNKSFMTSSCTSALHMALILAGVRRGDEVITTPMSWVATSNVVFYQGAKPVFADVDPKTGILDLEDVEKKRTWKTRAIIVVHYCGQMADMKAFHAYSLKTGIPVIEDAAHALEAERDGIKPGQLSTACFSFHAAKNITCGQGGAIVGADIEKCKLLVRDGVKNIDGKRVMLDFGYKYDSTDFQAALLIGQVKRLAKTHALRLEVFKRYEEGFRGKIAFPTRTGIHAAHMFTIWVNPKRRDAIRRRLAEKGIDTSIHYLPIHKEPWYQQHGYKNVSLPIAEAIGEATITLPTYPMSKKMQDYVITEVLGCE